MAVIFSCFVSVFASVYVLFPSTQLCCFGEFSIQGRRTVQGRESGSQTRREKELGENCNRRQKKKKNPLQRFWSLSLSPSLFHSLSQKKIPTGFFVREVSVAQRLVTSTTICQRLYFLADDSSVIALIISTPHG